MILAVFILAIVMQPSCIQAVDLREVSKSNQTILTNSTTTQSLAAHKKRKHHGHRKSHKHEKHLLQTDSNSDPDEFEASDENDADVDDSVSIEQVDEKPKTASNSQSQAQAPSTSNDTVNYDTRLTKNTSYWHLEKFQNLRVALSDLISDNLSFLKNIFPAPPPPDGQDNESVSKSQYMKVLPTAGSKKSGGGNKLSSMSQFSINGLKFYQMSNGELFGLIFLIMFLVCCVPCIICICCILCLQNRDS